MAIEVIIPAMGESITSGILAAWHVNDGDPVTEGQPIFELETDKITSEATAEAAGIISILVEADEEVEIGQVVARIEPGTGTPAKESVETTSEPEPAPTEATPPQASEKPHASESAEVTVDPTAPLSPAARKAAAESGIDVSTLNGSGKEGRVTKHDILDAAKNTTDPGATQAPSAPLSAETGTVRETRRKMTPLRRKIAEHLVNATQQSAMLTTFNEVDMSAVMQLRKTHQEAFVERHGIKLGFMSFFTKAVTHALKAVPQVNARIEGNEIVEQHYCDIGVAVGTDKGLMVPVIRDCDEKDFAGIEKAILGYAKAAREGKIQYQDLEGGVFTISNGGIYGSMLSTPIINFPQPAILGLHNIQQRPVVRDGEIVARPMMYLALSYDHRLIDGKEAVTFLVKVKEAIEDPARLLFGI